MKPWSQWVQENTGTLFCLGSFFGLLIFTVHVEHHGDHDLVNWAMNLGFGAFTAFLALIKASNKSAFQRRSPTAGNQAHRTDREANPTVANRRWAYGRSGYAR